MNLSKEQAEKFNRRVIEETKKEYDTFIQAFKAGRCYLCGLELRKFDIYKPCLHWLLLPSGFKKRYFRLIYNNFDHFQIQAYLRWVANIEGFGRNINDLEGEKSPSKVIETTIKYKNFEWSFSCDNTDLKGHWLRISSDARKPHYHFQIQLDGKPFINYSDFHIPLTNRDLFNIKVIRGEIDKAEHSFGPGMGMDEILNSPPELLLKNTQATNDLSKATTHLQTFIVAEPGKTIKGEDIAKLLKERDRTGIPVAQLLKKLKGVRVRTIITPAPGMPDIAKRLGGRKRKKRR